jgi:hypothetical protein
MVELVLEGCDPILIGIKFCSSFQISGLELLNLGFQLYSKLLFNMLGSSSLVTLFSEVVMVDFHGGGHKVEICQVVFI